MGVSLGKSQVCGCFDVKYVTAPSVICSNLDGKLPQGPRCANELSEATVVELSVGSSDASICMIEEMESVYSLDHTMSANPSGDGCHGSYPLCIACTAATYWEDKETVDCQSLDQQ